MVNKVVDKKEKSTSMVKNHNTGKGLKNNIAKQAIKKLKSETKSQTPNTLVVKKNNVNSNVLAINNNSKITQNKSTIGKVMDGTAVATGKRKRSIAKVWCKEKTGKLSIAVNDLDYKSFFTKLVNQNTVYAPFAILGITTGYVVRAEVFGGGKSGQADALKLGISRCLALLSEEYAKLLRKNSFLTRDSRKVEPKKAGLKKARKKEQFSKR